VKVTPTALPDVLVVEPDMHADERGFFFESFDAKTFAAATGRETQFVQDYHSGSAKDVLRGLHYQIKQPQGKLVRAMAGEVFDVAVDLRRASPTFGQWVGVTLSAENRKQIWIPEGFAHGFLTLSRQAELLYKVTDYYAPEHGRSLLWNDPGIGIAWPLQHAPILSAKDRAAAPLTRAEVYG
jgi:dTDP-4-dehydrorhamnose 3,5-epimerase